MKQTNKDLEMLYQGEDITKLEQPKQNWKELFKTIVISVIMVLIIGLIGTIFSLKEDVAWYQEHSLIQPK